GHLTSVRSVHFMPDGKTLLSGGTQLEGLRTGAPGESETKFMRLWDVATGRERQVSLGEAFYVMTLSSDGRTVASIAPSGGKIILWETITGGRRAELAGRSDWVHDVAFSRDSRTLAAADAEFVRLWAL